MSEGVRERVADAIAALTSTDPAVVERDATALVRVCGPTRIGSRRVIELLRGFADALPDTSAEDSGMLDDTSSDDASSVGVARVADALEHVLLDAGEPEGGCALGSTLLALATHLTGRTPHHMPDALGASATTAAASAEALGWALSADPTERLVAALTAPDPRLVDPLLRDPDVLVRTAAAFNRCRGPKAVERGPLRGSSAPTGAGSVGGIAALAMLRRELGGAGLAVPEIAERFARARRLRRYGDWSYASKPLPDPFEDYLFDVSAEGLLGPVQEQLAISHAGHGINSYALNLRLAVGPVAVMAQVGWGGVYSPEDADEEWSALADGVDLLTHGIALADDLRLERRRWLVIHSPFRMAALPMLLRRDGDRWVVPEELEDEDLDDADVPGGRDLRAIADRWVTIHNIVEQDLHVHERVWPAHGGLDVTIPDPQDPDPWSPLVAVVDADGSVIRLEFDAHDDMLERRGGVWERRDDSVRDWMLEVGRLTWVRRVDVEPETILRFDAAELAGVRLQLEALVGEDLG